MKLIRFCLQGQAENALIQFPPKTAYKSMNKCIRNNKNNNNSESVAQDTGRSFMVGFRSHWL